MVGSSIGSCKFSKNGCAKVQVSCEQKDDKDFCVEIVYLTLLQQLDVHDDQMITDDQADQRLR